MTCKTISSVLHKDGEEVLLIEVQRIPTASTSLPFSYSNVTLCNSLSTSKGADLSTLCFFLTNMAYRTRQDRSIATMLMGDETALYTLLKLDKNDVRLGIAMVDYNPEKM